MANESKAAAQTVGADDAAASSAAAAARARSSWAPQEEALSAAASSFTAFVQEARSRGAHPAMAPALILYATATGNARGIAELLHTQWKTDWPSAPVEWMSTEQLMQQPDNLSALSQLRLLVCVISTTGDGEEPDMARKFFREVRKRGRDFLRGVRVAVVALGSSDYSQFCEAGVKLRKLLVDPTRGAGAEEIMPIAKIDAAANEQEQVDKWKKKITAKLQSLHAEGGAEAPVANAPPAATPAAAVKEEFAASQRAQVADAVTEVKTQAADARADVEKSTASVASLSLNTEAPTAGVTGAAAAAAASSVPDPAAARARWAPQEDSPSATAATFASFVDSHSSAPALAPALILYATATGNARGIAELLHTQWKKDWPDAPVECMSTEQFMQQPENLPLLERLRVLVCVISTTGTGEEPEMARKFFRELRKRPKASLTPLRTALCALGSSDYSIFCGAGDKLKRLLVDPTKGAGAQEIMPMARIDAAANEGEQIEAWVKKVRAALQKLHDEKEQSATTAAAAAVAASTVAEKPAPVVEPVAALSELPSSVSSPGAAGSSPASAATSAAVAPAPVAAPAAAAATPKRTPACQVVWLSDDANVSARAAAPSSSSTGLPAYYAARWGNLDCERASLGSERESPAFVTLRGARFLTSPACHASGRMVVHMELEIPRGDRSFTYRPGDALGIFCANDRAEVTQLLQRIGWTEADAKARYFDLQCAKAHERRTQYAHLPSPCSVFDAFLFGKHLAAAAWPKPMLRALAEATTDPAEQKDFYELGGYDASGKLTKKVAGQVSRFDREVLEAKPTLLELLHRYPSCQPRVETLLELLPELAPRSYSLANAQGQHRAQSAAIMHIAWSKAEFERGDDHPAVKLYGATHKRIEGVCTRWMLQLCQAAGFTPLDSNDGAPLAAASPRTTAALLGAVRQKDGVFQIPVWRKHSDYFALPEDTKLPELAHTHSTSDLATVAAGATAAGQGVAVSQGAASDLSALHRPASVPVGLNQIGHAAPSATPVARGGLTPAVSSAQLAALADDERTLRPIIMVGPGTGVAPFRGFLQKRAALKAALESRSSCVGTWRGMDYFDVAEKSVAKRRAAKLQPPMSNEHGSLCVSGSPPPPVPAPGLEATAAAPALPALPVPVLSTSAPNVARGHYNDEIRFADDDEEGEADDGRFGGGEGDEDAEAHAGGARSAGSSDGASARRIGDMYLFFGCRRADWDYLYANDFVEFVESGVLTQLHVAFSREAAVAAPHATQGGSGVAAAAVPVTPAKFYVQDRMKLQGRMLAELLLNKGAYLYVCGDGTRMARDVREAVVELLQMHGGLSADEARQRVDYWRSRQGKEATYVEDIW